MKNWMVTLKSVCDACAGVPDIHKKSGKIDVIIRCTVCGSKKYVEKCITISSFSSVINAIQDGYNQSEITNMINAIKDGY